MTDRERTIEGLWLEPCRDVDFAWMLGEAPGRPDLRLPPRGVDTPDVLTLVRAIHAAADGDSDPATWMMIVDGEVVGLCGRVGPDEGGATEIGYSVAPERRRRGHATAAVGLLSRALLADAAANSVTAVTTADNGPSHRALARNGFVEIGRETHDGDEAVILWRLIRDAIPRIEGGRQACVDKL